MRFTPNPSYLNTKSAQSNQGRCFSYSGKMEKCSPFIQFKSTLLISLTYVMPYVGAWLVSPLSCVFVLAESNHCTVWSCGPIFQVPKPRGPQDHLPIILSPNTWAWVTFLSATVEFTFWSNIICAVPVPGLSSTSWKSLKCFFGGKRQHHWQNLITRKIHSEVYLWMCIFQQTEIFLKPVDLKKNKVCKLNDCTCRRWLP